MASYNELLALIDAYINRNGVQAITGQILNGVLKAMVDQLGRGYTLMGYAEPTGDPGTPDGPESWFASVPGTYTNYGEIQVAAGELALLSFAPSEGWTKNTIYEGFREVTATADDNIGFPQVGVTYANGVLSFDFKNIKGEPGENGQDGDPAGFGAVTASVDDQVGTPSVSVSSSGPDTAKVFSFAFHNLKGETGVTSVVATVDNTSGNPQCSVSLQGGQLTLAFTGLKGAQGDTGSSVDYPFTIVNNLTTNDATQALSAAMGVQLESEVSQLEAIVSNLAGKFYGVFGEDSELPEGSIVGYAFVGVSEPMNLYIFDGVDWVDTEILISGIVGPRGKQGEQGEQGEQGPPGVTSANVTVENSAGIPTATVSVENGVLTIHFSGIKGEQGNTGVSADYPIPIINNLTQGGSADALSAEMGKALNDYLVSLDNLVGDGAQKLDTLSLSWVQGTIDWDAGTNTNSAVSLRSGFISIGAKHILRVNCDTGYFIKGVFAYNTASLSDYSRVLYRGNASGTMDTTKTSIEMPSNGKVLRVVVGRVDGNTISTSEGAHIVAKDFYTGLGGSSLVDHVLSADSQLASINSIPADSERIVPTVLATYVKTDGTLVGLTDTYVSTELIDVEEDDVFTYIGYTGSLATPCAGYNSSGTFVQQLLTYGNYDEDKQTITIPSGIAKVRFCGRIDTHPLEIYKVSGGTMTARNAIIGLINKENARDYFSGKRLYVIGDSIAAGSVSSGTAPDSPFPELIAETLKMSLVNYGIGGSTIAPDVTDGGMFASLADLESATKVAGMYYTVLTGNQTYQVYYWNGSSLSESTHKLRTPIARRYSFMGDDADIIIVEAGTNDFQYNWMPVGTMADRTIDTFYGSLHVLCLGLLQKFYKKSIIFLTPIKRAQTVQDSGADTEAHKGGSYSTPDSENLFGKTLGDYSEIIKEVCRYYSIPVIDLYSNSLLNPSIASQAGLFDSWKTHPFQDGHNIIARYIIGQMKAIVGALI